MNPHCTIIAEAGVNHNGDLERARELIRVAAEAGADAVKFQTFRSAELVSASAMKAPYQIRQTGADESQLAMLRKLELSEADHLALIAHCRKCGIRFLSTGFDPASIDFLVASGVDRLKIPSGEITNFLLLRHAARHNLPVILSTGMATLDEVGEAIDTLQAAGLPREQVTLLHCTTAYPTPIDEVNLRAMLTLGKTFKVPVGYSDHTEGIEIAIAAAALGATVIEKHFTLDRKLPGPDHQASLEPDELRDLVRAVRHVTRALGNGEKTPTPSELNNIKAARRSIVAADTIRKGERFTESNLTVKRPGGGRSPMHWPRIIGQTATRDYAPHEVIE